MQYSDYQLRVIQEKEELDVKIEKLKDFTQSDLFASLSEEDQEELSIQLHYMIEYSNSLWRRIDKFKN